jgi:hypothetical protein
MEESMDKRVRKLSPVKTGIIILSLASALIHLVVLNIIFYVNAGSVDLLFMLNGLGYLTFLALYFAPNFIRWIGIIRWGFIAYTAVTIVAWFILGDLGDPLGIITKLIEIGLIVLLIQEGRAK